MSRSQATIGQVDTCREHNVSPPALVIERAPRDAQAIAALPAFKRIELARSLGLAATNDFVPGLRIAEQAVRLARALAEHDSHIEQGAVAMGTPLPDSACGGAATTASLLARSFNGVRFRCILADPPWPFRDRGSRISPEHPGCSAGYRLTTVDEIEALDVASISADDALLFLWTTWAHLLDGSAARVAAAWGFLPKTVIPWLKVSPGRSEASYVEHAAVRTLFEAGLVLQIGAGHYTRGVTEALILAVRRPGLIPNAGRLPGLIVAPRGRHSAKPDESFALIEDLSEGPRLELFARGRARTGWTTWGAQAEPANAPKVGNG